MKLLKPGKQNEMIIYPECYKSGNNFKTWQGRYEPRCEKTGLPGSDTFQAVQSQKTARSLKISDLISRGIVLSM